MLDAPDLFAATVGGIVSGVIAAWLVWNYKPWFQNVGNALMNWKTDAEKVATVLKSDLDFVEQRFSTMEAKVRQVKAAIETPASPTAQPPATPPTTTVS